MHKTQGRGDKKQPPLGQVPCRSLPTPTTTTALNEHAKGRGEGEGEAQDIWTGGKLLLNRRQSADSAQVSGLGETKLVKWA